MWSELAYFVYNWVVIFNRFFFVKGLIYFNVFVFISAEFFVFVESTSVCIIVTSY